MRFSSAKKINFENIKKEKKESGLYIILDKNKKELYVGSSKNIQHRLEAIRYGRADYVQVDSKRILRKNAVYYKTLYTSIKKARKKEKGLKKELEFNTK